MRMMVNIDVPELEPAIEFYSGGLGLNVQRIIEDDVAEMGGHSVLIYLLAHSPGSLPVKSLSTTRHYDRHWTPVHIDFIVDDLVGACNRVIAAGAKRESDCVEWRGSRCVSFTDPFGHGFCLIEFTHHSYQ